MKSTPLGLLFLLTPDLMSASGKNAVGYINPIIGTGPKGKTYPGAAPPVGMVHLSPDTIIGGDNGMGYRRYNTTIQGFSFIRISGVGWYGGLCNLLVMPTSGPL